MSSYFSDHITGLLERYQRVFEQSAEQGFPLEYLLIHSGTEQCYFADDQAISFRAFGHFSHWLPVTRPNQMLLIAPANKTVYFQVIPADYWYDQTIENARWWCDEFEIVTLTESGQVKRTLRELPTGLENLSFLGDNKEFAESLGVAAKHINPPHLLHALDYYRAYKSSYEIEQIAAANKLALKGHLAAEHCFENGGSEFDVHTEYLSACNILEEQCPYTNIVAINEKSAILHYQHKRQFLSNNNTAKNLVLLIDAGCKINNYCSDITRTSLHPDTHSTFQSLHSAMDSLQLSLVNQVQPGLSYVDFHHRALKLLAQVLIDHDIVTCQLDKSLELSIPSLFMPHGIGHLLGIQVHDVGGHSSDPHGSRCPPPSAFPYLRNTRTMEESMVFTVEPGLYFIPLLLEKHRSSPMAEHLNWKLIEELTPLGGIRIEDNVRVTRSGVENLTR
jgi:Xaa-Pro dipeptidase